MITYSKFSIQSLKGSTQSFWDSSRFFTKISSDLWSICLFTLSMFANTFIISKKRWRRWGRRGDKCVVVPKQSSGPFFENIAYGWIFANGTVRFMRASCVVFVRKIHIRHLKEMFDSSHRHNTSKHQQNELNSQRGILFCVLCPMKFRMSCVSLGV